VSRREEKRREEAEKSGGREIVVRNERIETKIVPATRNEGKTHSVCSLAALSCSIVRRPTIVQFAVTMDHRRSFLVPLHPPPVIFSSFLSNLRRIHHLSREHPPYIISFCSDAVALRNDATARRNGASFFSLLTIFLAVMSLAGFRTWCKKSPIAYNGGSSVISTN